MPPTLAARRGQHYAEKWLVLDRRPLNPLTRQEAQRRHECREEYVALIGSPDLPTHVVAIVGPWVKVSFLDDEGREYLMYSFKELRPGDLFLKQAIHREFDGKTAELNVATIFAFDEKGKIIIEHQDRKKDRVETRKAKADPTPNWERFPDFGAYETLIQEDRSLLK